MSDGSSTERVPVGRPSRRRFVAGACAGAVALLAGCSSDGGDDTGGGADTTPDGGDGSGGDGDGPGGDDSDGSTTEASDGGGDGSGDDGASDDDGGGGGSSAALSETMTFETSYAMDATLETEQGTREMSGRFSGGNVYWQFDMQGQSAEVYIVDGTQYIVTSGQCLVGGQNNQAPGADPSEFESPETSSTIQASGTTTIDGTEVYVYEVDAGATTTADGAVTYYVATDTGYPRRIETASGTWNFHSWGSAAPVEKPDMNCQSMSQGGG